MKDFNGYNLTAGCVYIKRNGDKITLKMNNKSNGMETLNWLIPEERPLFYYSNSSKKGNLITPSSPPLNSDHDIVGYWEEED